MVLALSPSSLGIGRATHFGCSPQIHDTSQVPLFTADHSQFLGTIQVPLFSCPRSLAQFRFPSFQLPQILSTVQVPLFSAAPDPYHSPGAPLFSCPRSMPQSRCRLLPTFYRPTIPPLTQSLSFPFPSSPRTRRDTPFSAKFPVSQTKTTLQHALQSSDTPFSGKFPVSRKGKCRFHKV